MASSDKIEGKRKRENENKPSEKNLEMEKGRKKEFNVKYVSETGRSVYEKGY